MTPDWIAVDWGSSRLRAWAMQGEAVLAETATDSGAGGLSAEGFEPALLAAVGGWLGDRAVPVVACGMVGSRQGWVEASYRPVPCTPLGLPLTRAPARDPRLQVWIVPGLSQLRPSADVIRGEETQVAGLLLREPGFDGVLCLPGTHSKWVAISAGEVTSFQTVMTGEVFALLTETSLLRHTTRSAGPDEGFDGAAFDAGVSAALSRPEALTAGLFALRAEPLLTGLSAAAARARLSGLLIGAELAATRPWWLGRRVVLVGAAALVALYARALAAQGLTAEQPDGAGLTLDGLRAARRLL